MRFHKTILVTLILLFTQIAKATDLVDSETCFRIQVGAYVTLKADLVFNPYVSEISVEGSLPLRGSSARKFGYLQNLDTEKMGRFRVLPKPRLQIVPANTTYVVKSVDFQEGRNLSEPMLTPRNEMSAITGFFIDNAESSASFRFGINLSPLNGIGPDMLAPCPGWLSIKDFKDLMHVEVHYRTLNPREIR